MEAGTLRVAVHLAPDLGGGVRSALLPKCCLLEGRWTLSWLSCQEVSKQALALHRLGKVDQKQSALSLHDLPTPVTQQVGCQEGDLQPLWL